MQNTKPERDMQQQISPLNVNGSNIGAVLSKPEQFLQGFQQLQRMNLPLPINLAAHTQTTTTPPPATNFLDSIATVAANQLDEKEERLRKRRSQIAAASRKSRAKRKREVAILKTENEKLSKEINILKKRLKELGDEVDSDDEESAAEKFVPNAEEKKVTNERQTAKKEDQNIVKSGNGSSKSIEADKVKPVDANAIAQTPDYETTKEFFQKRLAIYFAQLKEDTINHIIQSTPEAATKVKDRLSKLEVNVIVGSSSGADEKVTPNIKEEK